MTKKQPPVLLLFDPARPCFKCASENISPGIWHPLPVRVVGGEPTACGQFFPAEITEHLCRNCNDCGYSWCEAAQSTGPVYRL